jgi:hypothetical protein
MASLPGPPANYLKGGLVRGEGNPEALKGRPCVIHLRSVQACFQDLHGSAGLRYRVAAKGVDNSCIFQ